MKTFQRIGAALVLAAFLTGCSHTEHTATTLPPQNIQTSESKSVPAPELTSESLYDYEIKTRADGSQYAIIQGFRNDDATLIPPGWDAAFPKELGGAVVTAFAPNAFQNIPLGNYSYGKLRISADIESIGAHCFENCGLTDIIFEKQDWTQTDFAAPLTIQERAIPSYGASILATERCFWTEQSLQTAQKQVIFVICPIRIKQPPWQTR